VFPYAGSADGGQVNNWGRSYPQGGIYDPGAGAWEVLPDPASDENFEIAGVVGESGAAFVAPSGMVLDLLGVEWLTIPESPDSDLGLFNRTVVSTSRLRIHRHSLFKAEASTRPSALAESNRRGTLC
jgi:hypothetical protein